MLEELELKKQQLENELDSASRQLVQETASRVAAESKAELESKMREEQERLRAAELLEAQQRQEAVRRAYLVHLNALNDQGKSQLHIACEHRNYHEINRLMREGADINVRDRQGRTCLDVVRKRIIPGAFRGTDENEILALALVNYVARGYFTEPSHFEGNPKSRLSSMSSSPHVQIDNNSVQKRHQEAHEKARRLMKM